MILLFKNYIQLNYLKEQWMPLIVCGLRYWNAPKSNLFKYIATRLRRN